MTWVAWSRSNTLLGVATAWATFATLARGVLVFSAAMQVSASRQIVLARASIYFAIAGGGLIASASSRCDVVAAAPIGLVMLFASIADATRYAGVVAPHVQMIDRVVVVQTALALCAYAVGVAECTPTAVVAFSKFAMLQGTAAAWYAWFVTAPSRAMGIPISIARETQMLFRLYALVVACCVPKIALEAARITPWPFTGHGWLEGAVHAPVVFALLVDATKLQGSTAWSRAMLPPLLASTAFATFHTPTSIIAQFVVLTIIPPLFAYRTVELINTRTTASVRLQPVVVSVAAYGARTVALSTCPVFLLLANTSPATSFIHGTTLVLSIVTVALVVLHMLDELIAYIVSTPRTRIAVWERPEYELEGVPVIVQSAAVLSFLAHASDPWVAIKDPFELSVLWNDRRPIEQSFSSIVLSLLTPHTVSAVVFARLVYATMDMLYRGGDPYATLLAAAPGVAAICRVAVHASAATARTTAPMALILVAQQEAIVGTARAIARAFGTFESSANARAELVKYIAQLGVAQCANLVVRANVRGLSPNSAALLALFAALARHAHAVGSRVNTLRAVTTRLIVQLANASALVILAIAHTNDARHTSALSVIAHMALIAPTLFSEVGVFGILISVERFRYFIESILYGAHISRRRAQRRMTN